MGVWRREPEGQKHVRQREVRQGGCVLVLLIVASRRFPGVRLLCSQPSPAVSLPLWGLAADCGCGMGLPRATVPLGPWGPKRLHTVQYADVGILDSSSEYSPNLRNVITGKGQC